MKVGAFLKRYAKPLLIGGATLLVLGGKKKKQFGPRKKKGQTLTEREARLGLNPGDEAIAYKVIEKWKPMATEMHEEFPDVDVQRTLEFIHHEDGGRTDRCSPAGACGLMQIMPSVIKQYKVKDWRDPRQNMRAGVHVLSDHQKKFTKDLDYVSAAYVGGAAGPVAKQFKQGTKNFSGYTGQYVTRARALHKLYNELL